MAKGIIASVRNLFNRLFPERQLYHRSHGQVRFVSMSAQTQIALLIVTLAFLSWVAYASVNVVFKEQIISAKERNLVTMQQSYEVKLSEMQAAFDRLHAFMIQAEDRFMRETEILQAKQTHLETLVSRKETLKRDLASLQTKLSIARADEKPEPNTNRLLMQVTELEPSRRVSRNAIPQRRAGRIELIGTLAALTVARDDDPPVSGAQADRLSHIDAKIAGLQAAQRDMVVKFEERVEHEIDRIESILDVTKIEVDHLVRKAGQGAPGEGVGGPLISIEDVADELKQDPGGEQFSRQVVRLAGRLQRLTELNTALTNTPLVKPVSGLRISSGFGARLDPFTRRVALHSGTDFPGPFNAPVYVTADGVVARAGRYGAYGRLVEVDHGHGFKTRYAHLNKILVEVGDKVRFRQQVGELGSSGRSTGPHLHYEVWFDGKVLDAERFFEAGRYVFEN